MTKLKIVIPGNPLAQKRHRHTLSTKGKVWAYDPLAREKELVRRELAGIIGDYLVSNGPFTFPNVNFVFYMPIPKYLRKKEKEYANKELLRHAVKPDADNLVKLYLDCMSKVVIDDDRDVWITGAKKIYSPNPRVEIEIESGCRFIPEDMPRHDDSLTLKCDTPKCATTEIPSYSECPHYSGDPRLPDKYIDYRNRGVPSDKELPAP